MCGPRAAGGLLASVMLASACAGGEVPNDDVTSTAPATTARATTVVVNGSIYTVDDGLTTAEAFAYGADGVIIAVGTEAEVIAAAGADAEVLDAGGNMVLPGFQDIHVHVPEAGLNLDVCFFPGGRDLAEYETLAVDCAETQPDDEWVRAAGASLFDLRATEESPLEVLDRAVPDRPAIVLDDLGHAVWTNSLGLEAAGISPDDHDPQGGVFHRDATGRLTGLLLEDAQQLVRNAAAPSADTSYRGLLSSLDELASNGVTSVSDAGGYWAQGHQTVWERARDEGTLTVRAANSLYVYPSQRLDDQLAEFDLRFDDGGDLLRFDTAKVYVDGILDLGTALLLDPYQVPIDDNYPSGFSYFGQEQLVTYVSELHRLGYRINFHAIGDKAIRDALDAVEAIDADRDSTADRRHRITHAYLVDAADIARFADLGVIADFQQSPDAIATEYHEYLSTFIGETAFDLIPTAQLVEAGATVTLSSDWDAGPLPPLGTIERSLTRATNAITDLASAIAMHTIDAAYALGHDDTTGSIEVGKFADFVIVDQHLFDIDVDAISRTQVLYTVLGGRVTYQAPSFSP